MGRNELMEMMAAVRESIERLAESRSTDERGLTRALAHLWSAHDELELLMGQRRLVASAS